MGVDEVDQVQQDPNEELIVFDETEPAEPVPPRTGVIVTCVVVGLLIVGFVLYLALSRRAATEPEAKEEVVVSVRVAKAEKAPIALESSAVGNVVPSQQSTVSASLSAPIRQMAILKNALVKRGDVIAVLSSEDLVAQHNEAVANLEEAKLNLQTIEKVTIPQASAQSEKDIADAKAGVDNARATYDRRKVLYQQGGISLKELEASQLALTNAEDALRLAQKNAGINTGGVNPNSRAIAQAKIRQAQDRLAALDVQLARGTVRAPITGVVTDQFHFEGEYAPQGEKLVTVADISTVIVKAQFADTVVKSLRVGDPVTVHAPESPDEELKGSVTLISRSGDPQSRTVEVWARFGNPRGLLIANGTVEFVVESQEKRAIVVPVSAVTLEASNSDEGTVMVVGIDNVAHEQKVKIGIRQDDKVEIVEGLNGGETVVTEGNYALPDGTRVEVATDEESGSDEHKAKDKDKDQNKKGKDDDK